MGRHRHPHGVPLDWTALLHEVVDVLNAFRLDHGHRLVLRARNHEPATMLTPSRSARAGISAAPPGPAPEPWSWSSGTDPTCVRVSRQKSARPTPLFRPPARTDSVSARAYSCAESSLKGGSRHQRRHRGGMALAGPFTPRRPAPLASELQVGHGVVKALGPARRRGARSWSAARPHSGPDRSRRNR